MKVPYWFTKEADRRFRDFIKNTFSPSRMNSTQKVFLLVLIAITIFQVIYYDQRPSQQYLSDLVETTLGVLIPVCITAIYIFKD